MAEPILHQKPTEEELQAGIDAALKEETPTEKTEDNQEDQDNPQVVEEEEVEEETQVEEEVEEEEVEEEKEQPKDEKVDFEKRYKDSSREAHILAEGKKILEQEIDDAQSLPAPTEDDLRADLRKDGIEFEDLSDFEKKLAKDNLHQKNINNAIREIRNKAKADEERIDARSKEAETFSIHPDILKKFPKLEGRQEEFVAYASKPTRLVLDLEDLAKLFIVDLPEPKKNKGKMFEPGNGGPSDKPKPKSYKISVEQSEILRNTDYKKYIEYLKQGRIETTIE